MELITAISEARENSQIEACLQYVIFTRAGYLVVSHININTQVIYTFFNGIDI